MESTEGREFVKNIGDLEVTLKHIAPMQSCGNNVRCKNSSLLAASQSQVDGAIRVLLIWKSPEGKVVELSPTLLRFGSIKGVLLPINVEVSLKKLKFPTNFGEVKRDLGDRIGVKISDAKKENNIYKQNYGFRIILKDQVVDFENLFGLSHSKDLEPTGRRKTKNQQEIKEELSSKMEVKDIEHTEQF